MPVWPRTSSVLISVLRHVLQDVTYTILSMIPSPRPSRHKPARQPDPIASLSPSLGEGFVPVARGGTGARRYERTPAQLRHPQARAATPRGCVKRQIAATSALRMPLQAPPQPGSYSRWRRELPRGRTSTQRHARLLWPPVECPALLRGPSLPRPASVPACTVPGIACGVRRMQPPHQHRPRAGLLRRPRR